MIKILYVHGYMGKANGSASSFIKNELAKRNIEAEVFAPAIPLDNISEAIDYVAKLVDNYDLVIASSMGAMITMQIAGKKKILINPAIPDDIGNIPNNFDIHDFNFMNKKLDMFFNNFLDVEFKGESYFVFGTDDDIAHNIDLIKDNYFDNHIYVVNGMGHKLNASGAEVVVDIVEDIINDEEVFNPFPYIKEE